VFPAILVYQSSFEKMLAGGRRTEVFFITCLDNLVLCVGFGSPLSWPDGRHLLSDQLSNVCFQPSPSTCCLLSQWPDRKGEQGHEGEMSGATRKPGRCEGNRRYCNAKCYRDMEDT